MSILKVACIQLCSSPDLDKNLEALEARVREAAGAGAQVICTPENSDVIRFPPSIDHIAPDGDTHPGISLVSDLAKELGVYVLIGSFGVQLENGKKANRSYVFDPNGAVLDTYDKIHLFDVELPGGEAHRESDQYQAGDRAVLVDIERGDDVVKMGLSICYDVRFAHLYRDMAKAGAQILAVPAAFTVPTGRAHWEALLRARAIETGSFVLAPAQVGEHEGGRRTWGHSLIISPWGEILAEGSGAQTDIIYADLVLSHVRKARTAIPALMHDRDY